MRAPPLARASGRVSASSRRLRSFVKNRIDQLTIVSPIAPFRQVWLLLLPSLDDWLVSREAEFISYLQMK
jgi:hypothetical protein